MLSFITELLLLVGATTTFHFVDAPAVPVAFGGEVFATGGYTRCEGGRAEVTLAIRSPDLESTLAHELAHALDCGDDGALNGSPLPAGGTLAVASAHCYADRAEYYACWLVERSAPEPVAVLGEPASLSVR